MNENYCQLPEEEKRNKRKFLYILKSVKEHPIISIACSTGGVTAISFCGKAMFVLGKEDIIRIMLSIKEFFANNICVIVIGIVAITAVLCGTYCFVKKLKSEEKANNTIFNSAQKIIEQNGDIQINYKNGHKAVSITSSQKTKETLNGPPGNISVFSTHKRKAVNNEEDN